MTVAELIAELQKMPGDWPVLLLADPDEEYRVAHVLKRAALFLHNGWYEKDEVCDANAAVLMDYDWDNEQE